MYRFLSCLILSFNKKIYIFGNMCGRTDLLIENRSSALVATNPKDVIHLLNRTGFLNIMMVKNMPLLITAPTKIAPTDITPVLISASKFKHTAQTNRAVKPMMWGIIPPWHKGDYKNHNLSTNNCRIESIKSSKLYSPILHNGGRCVIIAEGFYEWQTTVKSKVRQPYYIYAPQEENLKIDDPTSWKSEFTEREGWKGIKLLHMAGLYHAWQNDGIIIYSYSVITMDSNNTLDWLHHRMPAILDNQEQIEAWLDIDNVDADMALSYLKPVNFLTWHLVSTAVNNSRNKSDNLNKRIESKTTQKTLTAFFTKSEKRKSNEITEERSKKIKLK